VGFKSSLTQILTTIAAVVLVGCGTTQQVTVQAPDISIHDAAMQGNLEAVKQHIAAGTDVNAKSRNGSIPLHYAAGYGQKEVTELLIDKGADVNAKGKYGGTPLHEAALNGQKENIEILIVEGADVNAIFQSGLLEGWTPLNMVDGEGEKETAALLRKHGGKTGEELKAEGK